MTVLISGTAWVKTKQAASGTWKFLDALILQTVFPQPLFSWQSWWNLMVTSGNGFIWGMSSITCFQCSSYCFQQQSLWWHVSLAEIKTMHSEKGNCLVKINRTKAGVLQSSLDPWNNGPAETKASLCLRAVKNSQELAKEARLLRSKKYSKHTKRPNAVSLKKLS